MTLVFQILALPESLSSSTKNRTLNTIKNHLGKTYDWLTSVIGMFADCHPFNSTMSCSKMEYNISPITVQTVELKFKFRNPLKFDISAMLEEQ